MECDHIENPDTGACMYCNVGMDYCPECDGTGTHRPACPEWDGPKPDCHRCGQPGTVWMDGPSATNPRALCAPCEYRDWRAAAAAYNSIEI